MNLKTYHADSIAEALREIKRELGRDAVILHTRTYRKGGWLGLRARTRVEITATSGVNIAPVRSRREGASGWASPAAAEAKRAYAQTAGRDRGSTSPDAPSARAGEDEVALTERAQTPSDEAMRSAIAAESLDADAAGAGEALARSVVAETRCAASEDAQALLLREMAAIKRLVAGVIRAGRASADPAPPDALVSRYAQLLESEVAAEIAGDVVAAVRDELTRAELGDDERVARAVCRRLASFIPAVGESFPPQAPDDGRPRTIALIGPTGVGKTTTVAKLASIYKLRHGKRVGLVTSDTYRIAAVDQLRTYANIIGLPLRVALTPREMAGACAALRECDVILIDTAGRSQHDADRLRELRDFVEAADPHETHLVLSGAASERVILEAANRFSLAGPDRLIFTKLDEMVQYGVLINAASRIGKQLSFVTTGQEVPDHLEPSCPNRLANLVLGGEQVR